MSDEYANVGFRGSLGNDSFETTGTMQNMDYQTGNYPPEGDTTASGGYGTSTNVWSSASQRGSMPAQEGDSKGLLDQSVSGGQIGKEVQDAKQGKDTTSREIFREEAERDFAREGGLTPYGRNPDNREEVKDTLGFTSRED